MRATTHFNPTNTVRVHAPVLAAADALPLVCDSPHSGVHYPADFVSCQPLAALRQGEDTHVAELWSAVPRQGGTLIEALFPRTYVDVNRELSDLDPELLDGPWPQPLAPGEKSRLGFGLIWRGLSADQPMYQRRLSVAEVQERIRNCWQPYHRALAQAVSAAQQAHGAVWHLNLHSMPGNAFARLGRSSEQPLADFVLGDRDGTTCEPALLDVIETSLRAHGYSVARNNPYKGVALIAQIGCPTQRRHSLQIEIRRPLYMDEASREPNAGFVPLQQSLSATLEALTAHIRTQLGR
ncbi:N-formylglutamate amidohydrolase [Paucibacter sp. AS339]|uniref:N-formylglutamate amidohydrolase n=1 Tax=Paucibacter hankyongi TaxID=3133434 RepID=UPI0030B279FC